MNLVIPGYRPGQHSTPLHSFPDPRGPFKSSVRRLESTGVLVLLGMDAVAYIAAMVSGPRFILENVTDSDIFTSENP